LGQATAAALGAAAAAPGSALAAPSSSSPTPVPSLIPGREACEACSAAVKAGEFLGPTGSSHYLAGCDIDQLRQRCIDETRRALPVRAAAFARQHRCQEAKALIEFAQRGGTMSAALSNAVRGCH
jgi:hypothetical protein